LVVGFVALVGVGFRSDVLFGTFARLGWSLFEIICWRFFSRKIGIFLRKNLKKVSEIALH
jgi:hypothetical protein